MLRRDTDYTVYATKRHRLTVYATKRHRLTVYATKRHRLTVYATKRHRLTVYATKEAAGGSPIKVIRPKGGGTPNRSLTARADSCSISPVTDAFTAMLFCAFRFNGTW